MKRKVLKMKKINSSLQYKQKLERNLYEAIKVLIILCQIVGAAPVNLYLSTCNCYSVESFFVKLKNFFSSVRQYLWCTIIFTAVSYAMYSQHLEFDVGMRFITRFLYTGVYFLTLWNCIIIMIGCQYQKEWYSKYIEKVVDVDSRLQMYGGQLKFCSLKQFIRNILIGTFIIVGCVIIIDFMYNQMIFVHFLRSMTIYILPNLTVLCALIEYISLLHIIKERYQQINYILQRLFNQIDDPSNNRTYCVLTVRPFTKLEAFVNFPYETILDVLRKLHYDLTVLEANINDSFAILLISTLVTTFMILCTQMYAFYTFVEVVDNIDIYLLVYTILWAILHAGKLYIVLLWNHKVTKEVSFFFTFDPPVRISSH